MLSIARPLSPSSPPRIAADEPVEHVRARETPSSCCGRRRLGRRRGCGSSAPPGRRARSSWRGRCRRRCRRRRARRGGTRRRRRRWRRGARCAGPNTSPLKAVGNHHVAANGNAVHCVLRSRGRRQSRLRLELADCRPLTRDCRLSTTHIGSGGTTHRRARGEIRHDPRQRVELALAGDQHVENRIGQQRQRQSHAARACPTARAATPPRVPTCDDCSVSRRA